MGAFSFSVDGFHAASNTVYEYHGCFFLACKKCFPTHRYKSRNCHDDRTIDEVYEATLKRTAMIRAARYQVVEKWGCEFVKEKKTDPDLQSFPESFEMLPLLEPRDAFFGGRTGATTLYAKVGEGEEICYVDFTSLYPSIGYIVECYFNLADQNIDRYFGIAQVDILPPERIFHPVLPVREGGKLTFPLCRACVREEMAKPLLERSNMCGHAREERMLRGTWCTPEIQKAVEKGYELVKIHEVFHFTPEKRRTGLFAEYVNTWLKLKQESAAWPADCDTEEKKDEYIRNYKEHEGMQLENAADNPGRKVIAKMLLNR